MTYFSDIEYDDHQRKDIRKGKKLQETEAEKLYKNADIEPSPDGNSLEDISKIEKYLNDVQIHVIDALDFNNVIYKEKTLIRIRYIY
jgi:hypothetical protein